MFNRTTTVLPTLKTEEGLLFDHLFFQLVRLDLDFNAIIQPTEFVISTIVLSENEVLKLKNSEKCTTF